MGTSGMILVGVAIEWAARVSVSDLLPELELGFGGPTAGAGGLGPAFLLPTHFLHGLVLGALFAGFLLLGERFRVAPHLPLWVDGLIFGAVVSLAVVTLLELTSAHQLSPGLAGLVVSMHLVFGTLLGAAVQAVRRSPPTAKSSIASVE